MSKSMWAKILGLGKEILNKSGEEVIVTYQNKEQKREQKRAEKNKKSLLKKNKGKVDREEWLPNIDQGQLVVDIYEKDEFLVIESAIAGVSSNDIDITVEPDLIVIRGERTKQQMPDVKYYYQECFWGKFSRTLVLPCSIKPEQVKANFKNGILTIFLPKDEKTINKVKVRQ